MEEKTKRLIRTFVLSAFLIIIMVSFSQTLGLSKSGFDTDIVLKQFFFYIAPAGLFLLGIFVLTFVENYIKEKDQIYGDSIAFADQGEPPFSLSIFKNMSSAQLFILFTLIIGIMGLFSFVTKQEAFTGVGVITQQFTVIDSLLFSSALIPAAENLGSAFLLAFFIFLIRQECRKRNVSKVNFIIYIYSTIFIIGLYGVANHLLRYSGQETSLGIVFIFWTFGALITLLTGNFIPFWIIHIFNNFFYDIKRYFSSDIILFSYIVFLVVLGLFYIYFYIIKKKGKVVIK